MHARFWIGLAAWIALAGAAHAQLYKWVDKDGRVQYGDYPPPGVKATALKPRAGAAPQPGAAGAQDASKGPLTPAEKELEFRRRQKEAQEAAAKQAQEKQLAEAQKQNCENAQQVLRSLEGGERIARTDASGARYFLEDEQRAQETARARKAVADWCK